MVDRPCLFSRKYLKKRTQNTVLYTVESRILREKRGWGPDYCRNNWHIHHAAKGGGQILLCTAGRGWYQEWGKPAQPLAPGDTVVIPPEVKHWHGAAKDSWFSHVALEVPGEDTRNEWCEAVSDEEYARLG